MSFLAAFKMMQSAFTPFSEDASLTACIRAVGDIRHLGCILGLARPLDLDSMPNRDSKADCYPGVIYEEEGGDLS